MSRPMPTVRFLWCACLMLGALVGCESELTGSSMAFVLEIVGLVVVAAVLWFGWELYTAPLRDDEGSPICGLESV